jgi:hypothetical protein
VADCDSPEAGEHEEDAAKRSDEASEELTPEERRFIADLLERGEAAEALDGELPDEATHEIVERPAGRPPKVERRRFNLD